MKAAHIPLTLIAFIALPACTLGPDFQLPAFNSGKTYKTPTSATATTLPDDWWKLFRDPELNQLVTRAIHNNNDLAAARARRDTARALVGTARARLFPRLDLASSAGINRATGDTLFPGIQLENQNYRSTLDLSYDPDLWGANKRRLQASTARATAAEQLLYSQRLGIAAEVARQYFLLRALDTQETILRQTIASRQEALTLQTSRQNAGLTDALAATRAQTELDLAHNDLAQIQRQRGSAENALAVLCGTTPANLTIAAKTKAATPPTITPGLPAEVLARRPDVRAAEQDLRAASAEIGIAQSALYPNITLTGSGGLESLTPGNFLDWQSRVLSLGTGLTAPLLDAGANRANLAAARSTYEETLARYRQTLLTALREVEDALLDLKSLAQSRAALQSALTSAEETRKITQEKFDKGLTNYLEVVEAERTLLTIRLTLAELDGQYRVSQTTLIQSLGGGWSGK